MRLFRDQRGFLSLEAALALPIFAIMILVLIFLIHLTRTELALSAAAYETVHQIATKAYPFYTIQQSDQAQEGLAPVKDFVGSLPSAWQKFLINEAQDRAGPLILPLVQELSHPKLLQEDRLEVRRLRLFQVDSPAEAYIEFTLGYKYEVSLPFFKKQWVIEKTAMERAWIGQT